MSLTHVIFTILSFSNRESASRMRSPPSSTSELSKITSRSRETMSKASVAVVRPALRSMFHRSVAVLVAILIGTCVVWAAIALSTSTPYTQNFDGMGVPATSTTASTLPADFRVDNPATARTVGTYATALTTVARAGGASLSTTAANGIYSFGSGTTSLGGSDRAVGFLSSGTATGSGNLYAQFVNNTG